MSLIRVNTHALAQLDCTSVDLNYQFFLKSYVSWGYRVTFQLWICISLMFAVRTCSSIPTSGARSSTACWGACNICKQTDFSQFAGNEILVITYPLYIGTNSGAIWEWRQETNEKDDQKLLRLSVLCLTAFTEGSLHCRLPLPSLKAVKCLHLPGGKLRHAKTSMNDSLYYHYCYFINISISLFLE